MMTTGVEVSVPSLEQAVGQAEAEVLAADRTTKEVETALADTEGLLEVLDASGPERAALMRQRDELRNRLARAQEAGVRTRRVVSGLQRRLRAAREVALAKEARTLREQVARGEAGLRGEFQKAAEALAVVLEAMQRALDAGEGLNELQHRLAAAENVLHPGRHLSVGRFRLHPMLASLLVGGDAALDWLRRQAGP
jgi:type IV secretory pathway VirJ component